MWHDKKVRSKWLIGDALAIRTATANKTLRGLWGNSKTRVEVSFYLKGLSKCQVVVQHTKLGGSVEASRMKKYWSEVLDRLKNNPGRRQSEEIQAFKKTSRIDSRRRTLTVYPDIT
jgi:hypothetical protein